MFAYVALVLLLLAFVSIEFYNKRQSVKTYFGCTWTSLDAFNEELGLSASAIQFDDSMIVQMVVDQELVSSTMDYKISVDVVSYLSNDITGNLNNSEGIWPPNLKFKISYGILTLFKDEDNIYYIAHV